MLIKVIELSKTSKKTNLVMAKVPPATYKRLHHIAQETGLSASALIREGLKLIDQEYTALQKG